MAAAKSIALSIASILNLIQSAIWISASITAVLVYLCEIEVAPYEDVSDFFRVTLIKLYFENKQCTLNGSYLGKFNLEYNDPDKISLLTPDIVFAAMVAYIILHFGQFFLSISLYKSNKRENEKTLLIKILNWGVVTIVISALDLFLSAEFIWDMLKLMDYMKNDYEVYNKESNIKGIEYIPLILAVASSRLIVFWLWNVSIAASFFLCGTCCNKVLGVRSEKKIMAPHKPPAKTTCHDSPKPCTYTIPSRQQPSDINKVVGRITAIDTHNGFTRRKDWNIYSKKTVSYFDDSPGTLPPVKDAEQKEVEDKKVAWNPSKPIHQHEEGTSEERDEKKDVHVKMVNEGFLNDNDEPVFFETDKDADFAHRFENFDQGHKKVKIEKPPLGKFVEPPVAPMTVGPENDSCTC